jgi:cytoskeletal protein RodZ
MQETTQTPEISNQPPIQNYTFSTIKPQRKSSLKKVFILILAAFCFFVLILGLLLVLNYFSIISLNSVNQTVINNNLTTNSNRQNTEQPIYLPESKTWKANGTLYMYNDNQIGIKTGVKIINLEFSSVNSMFYKQISILVGNTTPSATIQNTPFTLYELDQKVNLGKKVEVLYIQDKSGKNIIQTITLLN